MPKINRYWNSDPDSLVEREPPQTYDLCKVCEVVLILELRESYQKYKRCENMALKCAAYSFIFQYKVSILDDEHNLRNFYRRKRDRMDRWDLRWFKLAKEFKREYENGRR